MGKGSSAIIAEEERDPLGGKGKSWQSRMFEEYLRRHPSPWQSEQTERQGKV